MRKSNRLLSRFTGTFAALALVIGLAPATAFAADGEASITIKEPTWSDGSKDWAGTQANAYLVLDQVDDSETDPAKKLYSVTTDFDAFFNIDTDAGSGSIDEVFGTAGTGGIVYLWFDDTDLSAGRTQPASGEYITFSGDDAKALDKTYGEADLVSRIVGDGGEGGSNAGVFYSWIEKYIEKNRNSITEPLTAIAGSDATMTISNLKEGYYAIDFKNIPSGLSLKQGVMIATTGSTSAEMNLKAEDLPFDKKISEKDANEWFDELTAETGDVLDYQLTAQVPTLTDYDNLTKFTMSDTLEKQEFDPASVEIAINGAAITRGTGADSNKFYIGQTLLATLNPVGYANGESSFTLTFVPSALEAYEGKTVTVTYSGRLTTDAVKVNVNDAELEWSNNGSDSSLTDSTEVYTYGIELTKTFSDATVSAEEIGEVTFQLYRVNQQTQAEEPLYFTGSAGSYTLVSDSDGTGSVTKDLKLDTSSRKLTVVGLDDDETYILKETNTAEGYNLIDEDVTIDLEAQADPKAMLLDEGKTSVKLGSNNLTVSFVNNTDTTGTAIASVAFELYNQKGFRLPQTGGAGTWALTMGGILLIAAAGGLFVISRRKKSSK